MTTSDDPQIARRLRAARHLGGFKSVAALARELDQRTLGTTTLRSVERGVGTLDSMKRHAIAKACGLPDEFWTMDFWAAAGALQERSDVSRLRGDVEGLQEHLRRLQTQIQVAEAEAQPQNGEGAQPKTDQPQRGQQS